MPRELTDNDTHGFPLLVRFQLLNRWGGGFPEITGGKGTLFNFRPFT